MLLLSRVVAGFCVLVFAECQQSYPSNSSATAPAARCGALRQRWDEEQLYTELGHAINASQMRANCAAPPPLLHALRGCGMGSDLTTWGMSLCGAFVGGRALAVAPGWTKYNEDESEFGGWLAPTACPDARAAVPRGSKPLNGIDKFPKCSPKGVPGAQWRYGVYEFLFRSAPPAVRDGACAIATELFGPRGAPDDLILVHMRWDDKVNTDIPADAITVDRYLAAVAELVRTHAIVSPVIFLESQSREAVAAFTRSAPRAWSVRSWHSAVAMTHKESWLAPAAARAENSLHAFETLLVAAEARYFVLQTASSWSRLMDGMRRTRGEAACPGGGGCTELLDLFPEKDPAYLEKGRVKWEPKGGAADALVVAAQTGIRVEDVAGALHIPAAKLNQGLLNAAAHHSENTTREDEPPLQRAVEAGVDAAELAKELHVPVATLSSTLKKQTYETMKTHFDKKSHYELRGGTLAAAGGRASKGRGKGH